MKRVLAIVVAMTAPAQADLRVTIGNDAFTDLDRPVDDDGFTTDLGVAFWRPYRPNILVGGRFMHRWITEVPMFSAFRRRDLVDLDATIDWTPLDPRFANHVDVSGRAGPTFTGNLGGRWLQNAFHDVTGWGATLDRGLQDMYEGDTAFGVMIGGRVRGKIEPAPGLDLYSAIDAQLSLGTGLTFVDAALGVDYGGRVRDWLLGVTGEVAAVRFHATDERLAIPGGYDPGGFEGAWRVGVYVAYSRFRVDYQYRANEGGSGEAFGFVLLAFKQAGTRF